MNFADKCSSLAFGVMWCAVRRRPTEGPLLIHPPRDREHDWTSVCTSTACPHRRDFHRHQGQDQPPRSAEVVNPHAHPVSHARLASPDSRPTDRRPASALRTASRVISVSSRGVETVCGQILVSVFTTQTINWGFGAVPSRVLADTRSHDGPPGRVSV